MTKLQAILILSTVLSACGGGGGSPSAATPSGPVAISSANAQSAAASVLDASNSATSTGANSGTIFAASIQVESSDFDLSEFVLDYISRLPREQLQTSDVILGVVLPPTTLNCTEIGGFSGQITVSGNFADTNSLALSPGDTINSAFHLCEIEAGLIADGVMNLRVNSASGDPLLITPPYGLNATLSFNDFSMLDGLENFYADGTMAFLLTHDINNFLTIRISGDRIMVTEGANAEQTLFNYSIIEVTDLNNNTFTLDQSGILDSTLLGGSVEFTTLALFTGDVDANPSTGTLLLSGANNSTARIVAIDATNISISIDADGDGNPDGLPVIVAWNDLTL